VARRSSTRRLAALGVVGLASLFGVVLVCIRLLLTRTLDYGNLIPDLALAWVPLLFAVLAYDRYRRGTRGVALAAPLALWLLFLPNAPYLVTEFKLLRETHDMPVWFDIAVLCSIAWTGAVLGFVSVYLVQHIVQRARGALAGWLFVLASFGLCGIGVYVGRYLRWNSWDAVVQPAAVLRDVVGKLGSAQFAGVTLLTAALLTVMYSMLYAFLHAAVEDR
jgi:uncharacterized membrane protein